MDRAAIFVDAGYFFAQGSNCLAGQKQARGDLSLDINKLLTALEKFSATVSHVPLLRIYWYDGTSMGPTPQHLALAIKPNVKLRLGFVNAVGQQKGVDSLIVTDMITLARNNAMSDAILLSGDEDLRVGVQLAQEYGIRVHLLGICQHQSHPQKYNQSLFLLHEADDTHIWTSKEISTFLSVKPRAGIEKTIKSKEQIPESKTKPNSKNANAANSPSLQQLAKEYALEIDVNIIEGLITNFVSIKQIPPEIDRPLLGKAGRVLGTLEIEQKREIRVEFISALKARIAPPTKTK
jgi:hypothetical protein